MTHSRQLAAIMFTDIQGYTALMQHNEEKAIQVRDKHRRIFNSITEKHKGKVLQYFGDGTLSIFDSAIDAVECGIEMQLEFQKDPIIPLRVGIHEGDILLREDDIIGDGVNVASRIESLALPGSVFISDKIYDDIKNQKSITTKRMGSFVLKNVKNPVDVYAISNDGLMVPSKDQIKGKVKESIDDQSKTKSISRNYLRKYQIPGILSFILIITSIFLYMEEDFIGVGSDGTIDRSIAIIPFMNLSNDPEKDYFSDGISEDILTQISNIGDLRVISRSSVMGYKNTKKSSQEIAKELGVNHILEGSVRKYRDKIRIAVQLIETKKDNLLWARTFDRKADDIFAIQSEVSMEVAKALKSELSTQEEEDINKKLTENIEAYDYYLQGLYHLRSGSMEGLKKSYPLLRQAINLDSEFAEAYAGIADYYINLGAWRGVLTPELAKNEAIPYVMRALELDPNLKMARNQLSTIKWWFEWDFAGAEKEYIKAKAADNQGYYYGFYLMLMGRFSEADEHFVKSHQFNPMDIYDRTNRGVIQYFLNNGERSIEILKEGIDLFPNAIIGYHKLGKIYLNVGNYNEAIKILEQGMVLSNERIPAFLGELSIAYFKSGQPEKTEEIIEELKSIESKGSQRSSSFFLAQTYAGISELELAFEWLEKSYKAHDVEMIWLKIEPQFNSLRDDPRFTELLERVGFKD